MKPDATMCADCGELMGVSPGGTPHCEHCAGRALKQRSSAGSTPSPDGSDDDDDQPYGVSGGPEQVPCLNCGKALPLGALLCNHCGFNQNTGETLQRIFKKIDKAWEAGLRFQIRLGVFLAVAGLAAVATIVVAFAEGGLFPLLLSWLIGTALWAFVVGTYPRINITRGKTGHVRLAKTWRCCFIPLKPTDLRWRGCVGVAVVRSGRTDFLDWVILFFLAPWGVVPAFLWWYYVVRPDQLDVALTKEHGYHAILLYRGGHEAMANDIAATVRSVTGLA